MMEGIQTVLQDKSVMNGAIFTVAALSGQVANFGVRWLRKEVDCFVTYFFVDHWRASLAALIANIVGIVSAIALIGLEDQKPIWAIATGLGLGFMADSIINKGGRKEWTPEEREKAKEKP